MVVFIDETKSIKGMYGTAENSAERESAYRSILDVDTQELGHGVSENNTAGPSATQIEDTADQEPFDIDAFLRGFTFDSPMCLIREDPSSVEWVCSI